MAHLEARAMAAAGNQLGGADDFLGVRSIEKEGIRFDRFVREAAAAGLFPGEALVENRNLKTPAGKALAAEGAGRPSSDDGYIFAWRLLAVGPSYGVLRRERGSFATTSTVCQVSGKIAAMNQAASIAPKSAAPIAEPVRARNASVARRWSAENTAKAKKRMRISTSAFARR